MRWVWWGPDLWTPQGVALPAQCPVIFIIQPGVRFPLGMTPRTQNSHNSVSVSSTVTPASGARHHPGCVIMCQDCTQPKLKIQPDKDKQTIFSFFYFFIFPIRLTQSLPSLVIFPSCECGERTSGVRVLRWREARSGLWGAALTSPGPGPGLYPQYFPTHNTGAIFSRCHTLTQWTCQHSCVPCVLTSQWNFRFRKASLVSRENKNS